MCGIYFTATARNPATNEVYLETTLPSFSTLEATLADVRQHFIEDFDEGLYRYITVTNHLILNKPIRMIIDNTLFDFQQNHYFFAQYNWNDHVFDYIKVE